MSMIEYIKEIKRQFRDVFGFKPERVVNGEPCFDSIPNSEYTMIIDGRADFVRVHNGQISCCNFINVTRGNVLLAPLPQRQRSGGGIMLPPQYRDDELQWIVLGVGPGKIIRKKKREARHLAPPVAVGDHVICLSGLANKVAFANGRIIVDSDQVIAVVENDSKKVEPAQAAAS